MLANGNAVLVNSDGKLGTVVSSRRFKEGIEPIDHASDALFALRPVTFHYKKEIDPECKGQFGLVAEDVEKVNADLIVRDNEGKPYSVRYDQVNAMLLNEFLKEHKAFIKEQRKLEEQARKIQEQEAAVVKLEKQVEALVAHAKEQDARIQRVGAKLESAVGAQLASIP
jgi:trimeric autotransporter adhesin